MAPFAAGFGNSWKILDAGSEVPGQSWVPGRLGLPTPVSGWGPLGGSPPL